VEEGVTARAFFFFWLRESQSIECEFAARVVLRKVSNVF